MEYEELLDPETVQQLNEENTGIHAEEEFVRFYHWIVTKVNNDLPDIEDITKNEISLENLKKKLYQLCGKMAIYIALSKILDPLKHQESHLEIQVQYKLAPYQQSKSAAKAVLLFLSNNSL